ncbi:uncharacterized protein LOC122964346 isoform X2 [Acropora millepora]|uniref:uncharacterized protein LOC122964346 isoform X2 n=1 Tax=Acropora millepora TaxID=45264 RepID=UPI001CF5E7FB|nr:uncharacterized protein LOC122964346 isoform X2 [Acropora millepora]
MLIYNKCINYLFQVDWVKNKIRQLRNSYTKAKKVPPSGSARKVPTKRTAWLLEKLQFLAPHVAARPTVSNWDTHSPTPSTDSENTVEDDLEESDENKTNEDSPLSSKETTENPKSTKMPIKSRPKQAHKQREEEEFLLIKGIANSLSQNASKKAKSGQDGQSETFGSYVCETLQKLEPLSRNIAQHCINNILFQAQMGTLNENTIQSMLPPRQQSVLGPPQSPLLPPQQTTPFSNQQHRMMPHQPHMYPSDWPVQGHSPNCFD